MAKVSGNIEKKDCQEIMLPILDALEILKGKWKQIFQAFSFIHQSSAIPRNIQFSEGSDYLIKISG